MEGFRTDAKAVSQKRDNWWLVIAARVLTFLLFFGIGIPFTFLPVAIDPLYWLLATLGILGILLTLASGIAVYFDRQFVTAASEWHPSGLYYLMAVPFIPFIPDVIAIAYLYNRHKILDVP